MLSKALWSNVQVNQGEQIGKILLGRLSSIPNLHECMDLTQRAEFFFYTASDTHAELHLTLASVCEPEMN